MSSRNKKRRANRSALPAPDPIVVSLVNSVAVAVGGVYELTGSLAVAAVAGGGTAALVCLVLGLRCWRGTRR